MTKTPEELADKEAGRALFRRLFALAETEREAAERIVDLAERSGWHDLARVREIARATP
jgi:hypothetical protein